MHRIRASWKDDSGATAVEYSLMLAFIAVVIVAAVALLGQGVSNTFANSALSSAVS